MQKKLKMASLSPATIMQFIRWTYIFIIFDTSIFAFNKPNIKHDDSSQFHPLNMHTRNNTDHKAYLVVSSVSFMHFKTVPADRRQHVHSTETKNAFVFTSVTSRVWRKTSPKRLGDWEGGWEKALRVRIVLGEIKNEATHKIYSERARQTGREAQRDAEMYLLQRSY